MRAIYKIARLELSNLFYSPVAWVLIVILVFMMGSMFTKFFEGVAQYKELDGDAMFYAMSEQIFYGDEGIWKTVKLMDLELMKNYLKIMKPTERLHYHNYQKKN